CLMLEPVPTHCGVAEQALKRLSCPFDHSSSDTGTTVRSPTQADGSPTVRRCISYSAMSGRNLAWRPRNVNTPSFDIHRFATPGNSASAASQSASNADVPGPYDLGPTLTLPLKTLLRSPVGQSTSPRIALMRSPTVPSSGSDSPYSTLPSAN